MCAHYNHRLRCRGPGYYIRAYALQAACIIASRLLWSRGQAYSSPWKNPSSRRRTMSRSPLSVTHYFARLCDPRRNHLKRHLLIDIIVIALCGVISGADDWQQIVTFAHQRRSWLETFLGLPNGIPSHDTLERVFDRLDPQAFQACFRGWVEALAQTLGVRHIAIDGKTLRHSGNTRKGWKPLHIVSAWATQCH